MDDPGIMIRTLFAKWILANVECNLDEAQEYQTMMNLRGWRAVGTAIPTLERA